MSNEYKDWKADLRETFEEEVKELNIMYDGWVNSFIPQLKNELFDLLGSYVEQFNVLEIKEKFGSLRIYWGFDIDGLKDEYVEDIEELYENIENLLRKYEDISSKTCIVCGEPGVMRDDYWMTPWCDKCYENRYEVTDNA
jgi:hypothetical protein